MSHNVQAWQQRHDALLPLLLTRPPAALLIGPASFDPAAAAAGGAAPPLLLVSSPAGAPAEAGFGSILHGALGMPPSQAPLSASLLLQATRLDSVGEQLQQERAAAAAQLASALQEYAAAAPPACCRAAPATLAAASMHAGRRHSTLRSTHPCHRCGKEWGGVWWGAGHA